MKAFKRLLLKCDAHVVRTRKSPRKFHEQLQNVPVTNRNSPALKNADATIERMNTIGAPANQIDTMRQLQIEGADVEANLPVRI